MIDLLDQQMEKSQPANLAATWMTVRTIIYRYLLLLKRRWWVAFLTMSIGLAVAGWIAGQLPPSYQSAARMMVSGKINLPEGAIFSEELSNFFGTQMELMQSGEVQSRALARVQSLRPELQPVPVELAIGQQPKTAIFILTAVASDAQFAREYLNACMEEYIATKRGMRTQKSDSTLTALTAQYSSAEAELRDAREKLLQFQASNNLGYLKEEGNSAALHLANLNRQYTELKIDYQLLESMTLDQALERKSGLATDGASAATEKALANFGPTADYLRARQQLQMLQAEREQLSQYMRPKHPEIIRLDEEIARAERLIDTFRKQSIEQLQSRREAIGLQMQNIERAKKDLETAAVDLSRKLVEHDRLKADVDRLQGIIDRLSNNLRNVDMTKAVEQDMISVLEKASEAESIRPGLVKVLLIGFAAGLVAGFAILFLMERLDDRVTSILDVQNQFSERILGQVVHQDNPEGALQLLQPNDERHSFAESFRSIRSSFLYLPEQDARPKSILITSAIPGEGKSTVSANLAIAFALAGAKTLLVDADLRRGGVHKTFSVNNDAGLSEVLRDMVPWQEVVKPTSQANLSVITRGGNLPQPSEHLLAPITDRFLEDIYKEYDYVIVDSAPVMVAEDTPCLAPKIDAVAVVMRLTLSSSRLTRRSIDRLKERQANVLGMVLNEIKASMPEYGYHYYGSYYSDEVKA